MTDLELAERCEQATGHPAEHRFRVLDLDILRAVEPDNEACRFGEQDSSGVHTAWEWTSGGVAYQRGASWGVLPVPRYTASLDAAMTLVPEDAWWSVMRTPCADGYDAEVANDDARRAATPALALCAAALRARALKEELE